MKIAQLNLKNSYWITAVLVVLLGGGLLNAQNNLATVPASIYVGNGAFQEPIIGAELELVLQENMGNQKRPVSTFIGRFQSDTAGLVTVSLIPNKNYLIQTSKKGFYTQLSKIKTTNFSRTQNNKKGISLRPRDVISVKGNIAIPEDTEGSVSLINKKTGFIRTEYLDASGNYTIKAMKEEAYDLHVVIEGVMDTIVELNAKTFEKSSANVPVVYNFIPNAPPPNFREGDVFDWEVFDLKFVERSPRLSSEIWLDTLSAVLKRNTDVVIRLEIHTDTRKSDRINWLLCKKRAAILEEELTERGIPTTQYEFELKGEDEPLNDCVDGVKCSKDDHNINNRVVMIVQIGDFLFKPKGFKKITNN